MTLDRAVNQEMHLCNRKQVHPIEDVRISPWPVDVAEFGADVYAQRKQVYVKQLYNQVSQTAWVSSRQWVRVAVGVRVAVLVGDKMPEWEPALDRGLGPSGPRLSCPAEWGRGSAMVRGTWGQYVTVSLRLQLTTHITNINPFATLSRIKCERYIFIKKRVRSFIEPRHFVSAYICMYMSIQHSSI